MIIICFRNALNNYNLIGCYNCKANAHRNKLMMLPTFAVCRLFVCAAAPALAATSSCHVLLRCAAPYAPRAHTCALPVPSERREGLRAPGSLLRNPPSPEGARSDDTSLLPTECLRRSPLRRSYLRREDPRVRAYTVLRVVPAQYRA